MSYFTRLKTLRTVIGLNQAEMGKCIGTPQTTYSNYENGTREIPISLLERVANQFGVNIGWLITGEISKTAAQKLERARQHAGLKPEDTAKLMGTTKEYIKAIESGQIAPSQGYLGKMCELYKCNMYEVLDETIKNVPVHTTTGDAKLDRTLVKYREINEMLDRNPETVQKIYEFLKGVEAVKGMKKLLTEEKENGKD